MGAEFIIEVQALQPLPLHTMQDMFKGIIKFFTKITFNEEVL